MSAPYDFVPTNRPTGVTLPSDGDAPIKAADVNPALQYIGDLAANSIARLEPVASLAALAAITTPANNQQRYVVGYGVYTFKTTTPLLVNASPWSIAATDATPGRWIADNALVRVPSFQTRKLESPLGITGLTTWGIGSGLLEFMTDTETGRYSQGISFKTVNVGASSYRIFHLNIDNFLVDRARLTNVQLNICPNAHGALPAALPKFTVIRHATNPWTYASITAPQNLLAAGYFEDTGVLLAGYIVGHKFGGNLDQNNDIDLDNYTYSVVVANEGGTNAASGLIIGPFEYVQIP